MNQILRYVLVALMALSLSVLAGGYLFVREVVTELQANLSQNGPVELGARVLDRHGAEIAVLGTKPRVWISLSEVPKMVRQAFICAEDREFYRHGGLSMKSILRAAWVNARRSETRQGGSTITQQLARALYLDGQKTMKRKIKEALLAVYLEQKYAKDEILEHYLNMVYFGSGAYGLASAARTYFDKSVATLTLGEAAMLAGLLQAPSRYAPNRQYALAKRRQEIVLERMLAAKVISKSKFIEARRQSIRVIAVDPDREKPYGHALDAVQAEAQKILDMRNIAQGGLIIETTLDRKLLVDSADFLSQLETDPKQRKTSAVEAAFYAMDPRTGSVLAMQGGRDYRRSQFNRAQRSRRPIGEMQKPFLLALAMEQGLDPDSSYRQSPIRESQGDGSGGGDAVVRMLLDRDAFIAAGLMSNLGFGTFRSFLQRMDVAMPGGDMDLALGRGLISLDTLTRTYGALASGGIIRRPHMITRIMTPTGKIVYRRPLDKGQRVMRSDSAYLVLETMRQIQGQRSDLSHGEKSNSENWVRFDSSNEDGRDQWGVVMGSRVVAGMWLGSEDGRSKVFTGDPSDLSTIRRFQEAVLTDIIRERSTYDEAKAPPTGISFRPFLDAEGFTTTSLNLPFRKALSQAL